HNDPERIKKKEPKIQQVNKAVLQHLHPEQVAVEIWRADELEVRRGLSSELDEMWSYVRSKANPRWLWHAIDHHTGQVLAYVFGRRKDAVFLQLKALLERLVPDAVPDDALMSPYKALATAVVTQALPDLARQAAEALDAALEALQKLTAQEPWDIMAGRVGDGARDAHCGPGTATQTWRSGSGFLFDMNPTLMESAVL